MKPSIQIIAALVLSGVAFSIGWVAGMRRRQFQAALEESKVAASSLRADDLVLSPEFREYLKGRIYYNLASKFPDDRGYLSRSSWDFGPVDFTVLKRRIYAKDPTFDSGSFDGATRHLSNAER